MKKNIIALSFFCFGAVYSQEITLEKIYNQFYQENYITGIRSMKDGNHYTTLTPKGITKHSYTETEKTESLLAGNFLDYTFSKDEKKVLTLKKHTPLYRRSFLGVFEVTDLKTGKKITLNHGKEIQEPSFSPDSKKIAFVAENNLFFQDLETKKITQITFDGEKNKILNAIADWVYEEEFAQTQLYQWTFDSQNIVFVKSDESLVKQVNLPTYQNQLYPNDLIFKYPKAGEENSKVSAHLYNITNKKISEIDLSSFKNYYIFRIIASEFSNDIILLTSERTQNATDVLKLNPNSLQIKKLFTEKDEKWIENDHITLSFIDKNHFIFSSERNGFNQLYLYNTNGKLIKNIIHKGNFDITEYYGYDAKKNEIILQTTEKGNLNRTISKINLKNLKSTIISQPTGHNNGDFSQNFNYFIEKHSTASTPPIFTLKNNEGKKIKELTHNHHLTEKLKKDGYIDKEFLKIPNQKGDLMNAFMIKPKNFDPSKKYPVLMYQYSGPGSQSVSNSWNSRNDLWFNILANHGVLVLCVDGRGTGFQGTEFKKSTYKNLGKLELEDQISAAQWISKQGYADSGRIGIFGWSFGGYISSLALTKGADIFKLGIAVAPVTHWKYYDTIYTERFMLTPQENSTGYEQNSPTNFAHLMKGKFLLIHGSADDNVHIQNTMEFSDALIKNGKQFELMIYPDKNHSIGGKNTRLHLYELMTQFILKNL